MTLRLNGSTSGYVEIDAPAVAGTSALTLPTGTGTIAKETGAWISYTPTWTNLTVGNGTYIHAAYIQIGKTVHVNFSFTFGSTTTVAGIFYPSLPVSPVGNPVGIGWGFDSSATMWNNLTFTPGAYFISASGTRYSNIVPWTWATDDSIRFSITYQTA